MPRCVICDHSTEIDGHRAIKWSNKERGYVCHKCSTSIYAASYRPISIGQSDAGEIPTLDVERPDFLAFEGVDFDQEEDAGTDT